jgi:hypothetical protein
MMARAKDATTTPDSVTPSLDPGTVPFAPFARSGSARVAIALLASTAAAVGLVALAAGCGASDKTSGVAQATLPEGVHSETLDHESCNESGHRVETLDSNNDGKPDIKRLYDNKTGNEVCRITDLDRDGKPDLYEYYDASGVLRRREAGYDGTGIVDVIEIYENGKLAKRELDTTGQHRVDTWDFYDTASGKILRRERDSTNDGRVDQWWTYDGDKVTIAIDRNGDGKPDPADTVTIGGSDEPPKPAASAPVADAAPPPPAPYVPAGMDAGDLTPMHLTPATTASDAGAPSDAKDAGVAAAAASKKGTKK